MNEIDPVVAVLVTLVALAVLYLVAVIIAAGGSLSRAWAGQRLAFRWAGDRDFADKVDALKQPARPPGPPRPNPEPIRFLTLLQRDGRLLDFLLEDISAAGDMELAAGVREIHRQCQKALKEHLVLEPVLSQEENTQVEIPAGFDPSTIRLTGNVTGQPPFKGTLIHRGWRVKEIKLGPPAPGQDHFVVQPAEVELA